MEQTIQRLRQCLIQACSRMRIQTHLWRHLNSMMRSCITNASLSPRFVTKSINMQQNWTLKTKRGEVMREVGQIGQYSLDQCLNTISMVDLNGSSGWSGRQSEESPALVRREISNSCQQALVLKLSDSIMRIICCRRTLPTDIVSRLTWWVDWWESSHRSQRRSRSGRQKDRGLSKWRMW